MFRKRRKRGHKYINGVKGAISLFLIVLMFPFVELASAFISSQKYNAAVSTLDEIMGSSMVSTLADYDKYINDRFGLYALSQENDLSQTYNQYLDYNMGVLPGGFKETYSSSITGKHTFMSDEVLRSQIDEYAKYNSPVLLTDQLLNIEELIKELEKSLNVSELLKMVSSGADLCGGVADYTKVVDELKTISDDLYDSIDKYDENYSSWLSNIKSLAQSMRDLEAAGERLESLNEQLDAALDAPPDPEGESDNSDLISSLMDSIEDCEDDIERYKKDIEKYKKNAKKKQEDYSQLHTDIIKKIDDDYKPKFIEALGAIKDIQTNASEVVTNTANKLTSDQLKQKKERLKQVDNELMEMGKKYGRDKYLDPYYSKLLDEKTSLSNEITDHQINKVKTDSAQAVVDAAAEDYKNSDALWDEASLIQLVNDIRNQKIKVDAYSVDSVTTETYGLPDGYNMEIVGILTSEELDKMYDSFSTMQTDATDILESLWEGIKGFISSLAKIKLAYDPALCSKIDTEYFLSEYGLVINDNLSGNSLTSVIDHLCLFSEAFNEFILGIARLKITEFFSNLVNLLDSCTNLLKSLENLGTSIANFATTAVTDPSQMASNLFYAYYLNTNLPCRTDYEKFSKVPFEDNTDFSTDLPVLENLVSIFKRYFGENSADSRIFSGAELEYLLVGSNDEIRNQSIVFLSIYVIRLIANIPALFSSEVATIAAGPQAPIVYILYALVEPLVDAVLLVSGAEVPLFKTQAFLTPSGIAEAAGELTSIAAIGDNEENLKKNFAKMIGYTDDIPKRTGNYLTDLFKFDYKEYLLLIMFIFQNGTSELKLFRNIIQMETLEYNRKNNLTYPYFDIRKTYTALESETEAQVKEFMPQIMNDSIFKVKRTQYRGY